ncbi:hypothetical protein BLA28_25310 [Eisenbergiella tayi]|nr:hypothetical protein BLA28_25310 [Eisenbergiella tayi]
MRQSVYAPEIKLRPPAVGKFQETAVLIVVFRIIRYNVTKQSKINFCTVLCNSVIFAKGRRKDWQGE